MEERCDWAVSIPPPQPDELSALAPPRRKKTPPTHTIPQHTHTHTDAPVRPSQHTHTHPDAPIGKQRSGSAGERGGSKKAPQSQAEPQGGGGGASPAVSRQRLQESLPKIPPLPSFKPRRSEPISLQETMLDFQRFIKEGPGRTVEVVRQFGRRGVDPEGDVTANGAQEEEPREERFLLYDEQPSSSSQRMRGRRTVTSDPASPASTSRSPSPSSSSNSESDMMMEEEQKAPTLPPQKLPERSSSSHHHPPHTTHQAARPIKSEPALSAPAPKNHHYSQSRPSAPRHPSQSPYPTTIPVFRPPQAQAPPSGPAAHRGGSSRGRGRRHQPLEEPPELQEEGEGQGEGQDYWGRSYAQAWRQYYNSLPPPYRHAYSSSHAWMAAYRMSSVYMQEMMKP